MLWDTHLHTRYSGDSTAEPEDMVQAALQHGLDGICFTDHIDYDYPKEPELFLFDMDAYQKELSELKEKYQNVLPICIGVELGLQPQAAEYNRQLLQNSILDFVIGSSHVVHGIDPYYPEYYEGKTEYEAYLEYFESIKQLISRGKGIELNTAGLKYGLGHPHPTEDALGRYRELGGEILTIGSDGHKPEHLAFDFKKVPSFLQDAGFRYYTVFKKRQPEFIPLP